MTVGRFQDRRHAGRVLAAKLAPLRGTGQLLILALPRGGVPVGYEVARALDAELDVLLVRKLGVPGQEEYAMGAIAPGGVRIVNMAVVTTMGITADQIAAVSAAEERELERRGRDYRRGRAPPELRGRTVILVDDGLATGSTMRAAAAAVAAGEPRRLVIAVPVGAPESCEAFRKEGLEVFCALAPRSFRAVGFWYGDFAQTSDREVRRLLDEARTGGEG